MNIFLFFLAFQFKAHAIELKHNIYGFVKANSLVSSKAVDSFGRSNLVAFTSAGNPVLSLNPNKPSQTFQVQQSRLGIESIYNKQIKSCVEFDFVDFSKSTPTVASVLRLRRAFGSIQTKNFEFKIGQDWDLFSPLAPYTYNLIGHYFTSGDLGFMRIQAQVLNHQDNFEHAMAIGFPTYNNQISESTPEYSLFPTLALRETLKLKNLNIGTAVIVGHLKDQQTDVVLTPYALNLFLSHNSLNFELQSEAYYGQNVDNLSLQGLSYSPNLAKINEFGFFVTAKLKLKNHGLWSGFGFAQITSSTQDNVLPSYSYNGSTPILSLTSGKSTGLGLLKNQTLRIGYDYTFLDKIKVYLEASQLYSTHKLDPLDASKNPNRESFVFELGLKMDI